MIVIKAAQFVALKEHARIEFLDEMTAHLTEFSPPTCKSLGSEKLRAVVQQGISRAERYGFTNRGPIRLFLELMFILGAGFDDDPQYSWAGETLRRKDFFNQMFKAGQLEHLANAYLEKAQGTEGEHFQQALLRLEEFAGRDDLLFSRTNLKQDVLLVLESIFPTRLECIGTAAAEDIIQRAGRLSDEIFGKDIPRAAAVLATLQFFFGVKCVDDPLYPWIGATLRDPRIIHRAVRAARLERKAVTWLKSGNASGRGIGLPVVVDSH